MTDPVFDVSGAVAVLNQVMQYAAPTMTVVGELASFRVSKGKWVYADLKDDHAKLRLFGAVYALPGPLTDGMMVEIVAHPRIHPLYGFSLSIESIRPVGEGSIKKAAHLLAEALMKEGLFDDSRKRPVPHAPSTVGLIASVESAAYSDFLKILDQRWGGVEVLSYDAQVQGEAAVDSIVQGVQQFNQLSSPPEVLVITRGGGSADDLGAFDTEPVIRVVAGSRIPTVVAIGHERDVSLSERAADLRASTPSNAAELLFPDGQAVQSRLHSQQKSLDESLQSFIDQKSQYGEYAVERLRMGTQSVIDTKAESLARASRLLDAFHPKATLRRGYALVQHASSGRLVSSAGDVGSGQEIIVTFADGPVTSIAK